MMVRWTSSTCVDGASDASAHEGAILALVSLWRVLLMARVMQRLTTAPFLMTLVWVLSAAAVEVLVVFVFGGAFSRKLVAGMGGMRNSPEEEVVLGAAGTAFLFAFLGVLPLFLVAIVWAPRMLTPLPAPVASVFRWRPLAAGTLVWALIAIGPQVELSRNVRVERWMTEGQMRAALDLCSTLPQDAFAPARPLPPLAYERSAFEQLPACFEAVQPTHAPWVRAHLVRRLDEMVSHYRPPGQRRPPESMERAVWFIRHGYYRYGLGPAAMLRLLHDLQRIEEGRTWLSTNIVFIEGMRQVVQDRPEKHGWGENTTNEWLAVSNVLQALPTRGVPSATDEHGPESPPRVPQSSVDTKSQQ